MEHLEVRVAPLQRFQLLSIRDFVDVTIAVNQTDRYRQRLVCRVLCHPFQRRDSDPAPDEDGWTRGVEDVVTQRPLYDVGISRLQRCERTLEGRVRHTNAVFEMRACR